MSFMWVANYDNNYLLWKIISNNEKEQVKEKLNKIKIFMTNF